MIVPGLLIAILSRELGLNIQSKWARAVLAILGVKISVADENIGSYGNPPYVFVVQNQTSLLEGFVTACCLPAPANPIINIEYALVPFLGWMKWILGGIVVLRGNHSQSIRAMEKAERKLRDGENIYLSIEGGRSRDGQLGEYKKGAAVIAINTGATLVPFYYRGMRERLPFGEWRVLPGVVDLVFCEAVPVKGLTYEDRDAVVEKLRTLAKGRL